MSQERAQGNGASGDGSGNGSGGNGGPLARITKTGITFHSPTAFYAGTAALALGVVLHLPYFADAKSAGYQLHGRPVTHLMLYGIALTVGGLILAAYGLFPRGIHGGDRGSAEARMLRFHGLDNAPLTPKHWRLLVVLVICLVIDVMKPATLGFVVPSLKTEYGLSDAVVALYPLMALVGLTIGSFVWGLLSDRLGRRSSILLGGLMFIATSLCTFMPTYQLNLFMCFLMGMAAGGFLPIVFALLGEIMPSRNRSMITVLIAGLGTAGGYLAASGFASVLIPHFGWRPMWLLNAPTGLIVILLNRFIPESPRFLLEAGRRDEAQQVMHEFGVTADTVDAEEAAADGSHDPLHLRGISNLFKGNLLPISVGVGLVGLAWGLVNFGFMLWLPKTLEKTYNIKAAAAATLIAKSSLIALPTSVVVALLYGRWSSKKTMVLFCLLTSVSLVGIALLGDGAAQHTGTLTLLVAGVLVAAGGVIAMLTPYASEVYPTSIRGTGTGYAAGASKAGGIAGPYLVVGIAALSPGLSAAALVVAVPISVASLYLGWKGIETRGRSLEDIALAELQPDAGAGPVTTPFRGPGDPDS